MPDSELIDLLGYLLPGFVAASIYYAFTSHVKPSAFERVVQALVFTIVVEAILGVAGALGCPWTDSVALPVAVAGILGLTVSAAVNHDLAHRLFRWLGVTRETSHPSGWYSAFARYQDSHVVLHLVGERRLYGWPSEWPTSPDQGHFRISEAEWLDGNNRSPAGHALLVQVEDVNMVEFVRTDRPDFGARPRWPRKRNCRRTNAHHRGRRSHRRRPPHHRCGHTAFRCMTRADSLAPPQGRPAQPM